MSLGSKHESGNRELDRIKAFLLTADIDVVAKERLWDALAAEPSFERRMMVLEGFDLDAPVRGVVAEILLAAPEPQRA